MKHSSGSAATKGGRRLRHKLVIVGDGNCGKTSLLVTYVDDTFPEKYVPTIFETHVVQVPVENGASKIPMILWDTAGQENYDMLRPISYPGTDVFVVCFSVDSPDSFYNVANKWIPELRHFATDIPVVLVATKTDLRQDLKVAESLEKTHQRTINVEEGVALAHTISACSYVECSAKQKIGVEEVFRKAAAASSLRKRCFGEKSARRQCVIL